MRLVAADLEARAIQAELQLQPSLPSLDGSEQQLTQVLLNLIKNAMEAMPNGGRLLVKTSQRTASPLLRLRPGRRPATVQVEIQDTGQGIPTDVIDRMFVPFFTTKEKGTGLGLPICQRIVEHHGGAIQVQSRPGEGTTFTLTFPCPTPAERPSDKAPDKAPDKPTPPPSSPAEGPG
jgi:two-component system sensor histidine kinase HydH